MDEPRNISQLLRTRLDPEDLAWDHAMEISGSVYKRMGELGLKSKDLADRMGVTPARISRILGGAQSMTLKTLARLESALDMNMGAGFKDPEVDLAGRSTVWEIVSSKPSGRGDSGWLPPQTLAVM